MRALQGGRETFFNDQGNMPIFQVEHSHHSAKKCFLLVHFIAPSIPPTHLDPHGLVELDVVVSPFVAAYGRSHPRAQGHPSSDSVVALLFPPAVIHPVIRPSSPSIPFHARAHPHSPISYSPSASCELSSLSLSFLAYSAVQKLDMREITHPTLFIRRNIPQLRVKS